MKKLINKFMKEYVYDFYYEVMADDSKYYNNITRSQMISAITDRFVDDKVQMVRFLETDERELLRDFAVKVQSDNTLELESYILGNARVFFAFETNNLNQIQMIPEFLEFFSNYDYETDYETQQYDSYKRFVMGAVIIHGALEHDVLKQLYESKKPDAFKHLDTPTIFKETELIRYLLRNDVEIQPGFIAHALYEIQSDSIRLVAPYDGYDLSYYEYFGETRLPQDYFENMVGQERVRMEYLARYLEFDISYVIQDLDMTIDDIFGALDDPEDPIHKFDPDLVSTWPLWTLGGQTLGSYIESLKGKTIDTHLRSPFIFFEHFIVHFANEINGYYPHIEDVWEFNQSLSIEQANEILLDIIGNQTYINAFYNLFDELDEHEFEVLNGFKHAIQIEGGYAFDYEGGKLKIYQDGTVYAVVGITTPLENIIDPSQLPLYVDTTLIPLKDSITFAITIKSDQFEIDDRAKARYSNEIKEAKTVYNIHDLD